MKRKNLYFIYIIYLLLVINGLSCSLSHGKSMVKKGQWAIEAATFNLIGNGHGASPVVPNIGLGFRYGILDDLNIGMIYHPTFMGLDWNLMIEPFVAYEALKSRGWIPRINIYSSLYMLTSFQTPEMRFFPLFGFLFGYKYKHVGWYIATEVSFDFYSFEAIAELNWNCRAGFNINIGKMFVITIETGMNDIGQRSDAHGFDYGQPVVALGLAVKF